MTSYLPKSFLPRRLKDNKMPIGGFNIFILTNVTGMNRGFTFILTSVNEQDIILRTVNDQLTNQYSV